jgi:hypothetical protein
MDELQAIVRRALRLGYHALVSTVVRILPLRLAHRIAPVHGAQARLRFLRVREDDFGIAARAHIALRDNGVVTIAIDQSPSTQKVESRFLGDRA